MTKFLNTFISIDNILNFKTIEQLINKIKELIIKIGTIYKNWLNLIEQDFIYESNLFKNSNNQLTSNDVSHIKNYFKQIKSLMTRVAKLNKLENFSLIIHQTSIIEFDQELFEFYYFLITTEVKFKNLLINLHVDVRNQLLDIIKDIKNSNDLLNKNSNELLKNNSDSIENINLNIYNICSEFFKNCNILFLFYYYIFKHLIQIIIISYNLCFVFLLQKL